MLLPPCSPVGQWACAGVRREREGFRPGLTPAPGMEDGSQHSILKERSWRGLVLLGQLLRDPDGSLEHHSGSEHHSILVELDLNPFWVISQYCAHLHTKSS